MAEFESTLENKGRLASGENSNTYELQNHKTVPERIMNNKILTLFKEIWEKGTLSKQFKHAIIVPIQKPGKKTQNPVSYRPMAFYHSLRVNLRNNTK